MKGGDSFFNLYSHNFARVAVAIPEVKVANPQFNAEQILNMMKQAAQEKALLVLFPELSLSAYSCEDLFHQKALLDASLRALQWLLEESQHLDIITVVGIPLVFEHHLFNCAVTFYHGRILGITPKTYLPNYREFYEMRQFTPAPSALKESVSLLGQENIPFGSKLLFQVEELEDFIFHAEICEDLWVALPPSSYAALAGATVLLNLSASNIIIGKSDYRHQLAAVQSARTLSAYLYSAAGTGESTTDLAWDGHAMIYENGDLLAESERFSQSSQLIMTEIDLERLVQERLRQNTFAFGIQLHRDELQQFRTISFSVDIDTQIPLSLRRLFERFPYVPADRTLRDKRAYEAYQIQVHGLIKRMKAAAIKKLVIGISGGLDSTHALIVAAKAMDLLGLPRKNILAYTMPGFATTSKTLHQAHELMKVIGCESHEIDIRPSCQQMLHDIGHPYDEGKKIYDITFENVQAGERTSHLFRLANYHNALVVGTGDLSELALGWCTYGVGDHIAHYNVNASVSKTLIQYLIRWVAETEQLGEATSRILRKILSSEITPELIPGTDEKGQPSQKTEAVIGPYELQDFHLYYILRYGYSPTRIAFLAHQTWSDKEKGHWGDIPEEQRHEYDLAAIKRYLRIFLWRFFQTSQFKRSCAPNAPKVSSGGSLSPRGDYRAPSDSEAAIWLAELDLIPEQEN